MSDDPTELDVEAVTELVGQSLRAEMPALAHMNFGVADLDCGEIFLRTPGGAYFRLIVEAIGADDAAGWGIDDAIAAQAPA